LKRIFFVLIALFAIHGFELKAKDSIINIDDNVDYYDLDKHALFYVDESGILGFDQITATGHRDKFSSIDDQLSHLEKGSATIWLQFKARNLLDRSPYLKIDNPALDTVVYYLVNKDDSVIYKHTSGSHQSILQRNIESADILIDLQLADSDLYTCFLKIKSHSTPILAPMRIATLEKLYVLKHYNSVWQGLYFGLIFFMFIYNIFLFISLRETTYIFFAFFIASMGWLFAIINGFGMNLMWVNVPIVHRFIPTIAAATGIFMILFSSRFLNSIEKAPKLHQWLTVLMGLFGIIAFLNLIGFQSITTTLVIYSSVVSLFFLMIVAIKSWKDNYEPAKLYLFSWSFCLVGILVGFLQDNYMVELYFFSGNILQITSSISILFMSFALSKKINVYIKNKNNAYQLAVKTALENEKLISSQNILLEAKVFQRTVDLEQSIGTLSRQRKDLHEANNFKDKVLSIISHDLKSPIATLAGMLNIMKMKSLTEDERSNVVDNLEVALKNTKNLLDNILAWAHKNDNGSKETDDVEVSSCVNEIFDLFRFQASEKLIELQSTIESGFNIQVHKNMFQLVLRNLVSNALKFTPKNGTISVSMKEDHQNILIHVKDSGIGMSKEIMDNLFNASKHTSTRGTENEKGTGLGLKLCKEFVDKYNGELSVSSKPGEGTTMTLKLRDAIPVLHSVAV